MSAHTSASSAISEIKYDYPASDSLLSSNSLTIEQVNLSPNTFPAASQIIIMSDNSAYGVRYNAADQDNKEELITNYMYNNVAMIPLHESQVYY